MLPKLSIVLLFLLPAVCKGFDFTFKQSFSKDLKVTRPGKACGVVTCTEKVADDDDDARKIKSLAVYRHMSVGVSGLSQWEQLASVTSQSPTDKRISDDKYIEGTLSESSARIEVRLLKSYDCANTKLACVARLQDEDGTGSTIKSEIGGKGGASELELVDIGQQEMKLKIAIVKKLGRLKDLLENNSKGNERLEEKLENLSKKFNSLERTLIHDINASSDRIEDKMDIMKNRLEDKLSELRAEKSSLMVEDTHLTEVFANVSSQLTVVSKSLDSLNKTTNSGVVQLTMSTASVLNDKLGIVVSAVSEMAAATNNLTADVQSLSHSCAATHHTPPPEFFDVFGSKEKVWRLAFRGTAYINVQIYPAYMHGTGIPSEVETGCKQLNHSLPCANHYRNNDALDKWTNVDKVLFAVYVKGVMVKYIMFNGRGSSWLNWFEESRVLDSSWTDLSTLKHNIFNIKGFARPDLLRRFYVNHVHGGCPKDLGWFVAADAIPGGCPWEKKVAYPAFLYAKGNTVSTWEARHTVASADTIGIFIKYQ